MEDRSGVPKSWCQHTSTAQRTNGNRGSSATTDEALCWFDVKQPERSLNVEPKPEQFDAAVASANTFSGGFQAIATAYGDYTKKSFEDTKSYVEKLSSVKSLDKAIEVQTEFAKTAYETFVAESQKIGALYGDLAKQSYKPFGGFVAKMTPTAR